MSDQGLSDSDQSRRDVPSFIEPRPPLITNPFMRPRPQKGTNLMELLEDSDLEEPDWVQVYLRLKPSNIPSSLYEVKNDRCLITSLDTATAGHGRRTQHNVSKMYTFSRIFGPECNQKEIFEQVVKDNLRKLPEGHNFTLLTYGASGSGKTYTLMGTVASPGLVPRSLEYVFRIVDAVQQPLYKPSEERAEKLTYSEQDFELQWVRDLRKVSAPLRDKYRRMSAQVRHDMTSTLDLTNRTRYYVWVSFVEIYNEAIYDLLSNSDRSKATSKLRLREDTSGNVYVKGAIQAFVRSGEEAYDVMVAGRHNLQVAATGVHAHSSRSHCIFTITLLTETEDGVRTSYVRLCDLAGSERARATRNTGARMAESRAINASLHVLERCLHTLRRKQRRVDNATLVPYRESKLTRLLGAGLSGSRGEAVSMVVTVNPAPQYAHETRHVLQLAAVARDIQINQTVAETESTFESSRDVTIEVNREVMQLRAENERLHFELIQAQSRNKELVASMAAKQQEVAATMTELVEEAKSFTRTYYEKQIALLRNEMEDMREEYEARLKAAESSSRVPEEGTGTPSRALQRKVNHLMGVVAVLEEKLSAEKLACQRAEDELQHLRACIEERDEKANEDSMKIREEDENDIIESESEESSDQDSCNESLEPTFKKEDINRSRLIRKSLANSMIEDYVSLKQLGIEKAVKSNKDDSIIIEDSHQNDSRHDNDGENDSVLEVTSSTVEDDEQNVTVRDSTQIDDDHNVSETRESIDLTEDSPEKIKEMVHSGNFDSLKSHETNDSTYMTGESGSGKFEETHSIENHNRENDFHDKTPEKNDPRDDINDEIHDVNESKDEENYDKFECSDVKHIEKSSLTRGTYFIRESSEASDKSNISSKSSCRETYFVKDRGDFNAASDNEDKSGSNKSSLTRGTYFVKEPIHDAQKYDDALSPIKDTYFSKNKEVTDIIVSKSNNAEDTSLKDANVKNKTDTTAAENIVKKFMHSRRQNHASDVSLAQFELFEKAANIKNSPVKRLSDVFSKIKISKDNPYFDDSLLSVSKNVTDPESVKSVLTKKLYFDDIGERSVETVTSDLNEERSPSIVKDDVDGNYEPSRIKKLLGESFTRPDVLPIHKVAFPKKQESIDIFEGFDSPGLVKSKLDAGILKITPPVFNVNTDEFTKDDTSKKTKADKKTQLNIESAKEVNDKPKKQSNETIEIFDYSKVVVKQEKMDFDFVRPKAARPVSILDTCIEKADDSKSSNSSSIVENTRKCIADLISCQKEKEIKEKHIKVERPSISNEHHGVIIDKNHAPTRENTIDEFEKIVKDITPNSTAFEFLVSETSVHEKENHDILNKLTDKVNESKTREFERVKYNLRHKHNTSEEKKEVLDETCQQSKTEKKPRRNLRLRRGKKDDNEKDNVDKDCTDAITDKQTMLKDIVNLQNEFSDVTLDVPVQKKIVTDIPSPEKDQEENQPPYLGVQSCPSKSVTRSRRKLFTPRAEPLEESFPSGGSDERERIRVPRPSYHRPRARRRL